MPKAIDLTGRKFGRLIAMRSLPSRSANGRVEWLCICDCGNERVANSNTLGRSVRSCGCLAIETSRANGRRTPGAPKKHGMHGRPEYIAWKAMRQRTGGKGSIADRELYAGIQCCERWHSFANFYADMGPRPSPQHSIDRIDTRGHYEPGNCRWATVEQQIANRRPRRSRAEVRMARGRLIADAIRREIGVVAQ